MVASVDWKQVLSLLSPKCLLNEGEILPCKLIHNVCVLTNDCLPTLLHVIHSCFVSLAFGCPCLHGWIGFLEALHEII